MNPATPDPDIFRLLTQSARGYAIFVLDPKGNIRCWSNGAQALKGYTADEIIDSVRTGNGGALLH